MNRFLKFAVTVAATIVVVLLILRAWPAGRAWAGGQPWAIHPWMQTAYLLHQEWFAVPLVALAYFAVLLVVRWNLIAWPARLILRQQIGDLKLRLKLEKTGDAEKDRKIADLQYTLEKAVERLNKVRLPDRIFWTRGQEMANGRHVSETERELAILQPEPMVRARLQTAVQELREIPTKSAGALAELIHHDLRGQPTEPRMRALLYEALGTIFGRRDDDNDSLLTWHSKTLWLSAVGILLLIALEGVKRGGGGLFALGATGGFLSRLMRTLKRANVPTDYGAYWTTLFLSPVVGALAGWTSVLLIELARYLQILGNMFAPITLNMPESYGNLPLTVAFLFGFSERLFDEILKPLEQKIGEREQASSIASSSSGGPPIAAPSAARVSSSSSGSSSSLHSGSSSSRASSSTVRGSSSSGSSSSSSSSSPRVSSSSSSSRSI